MEGGLPGGRGWHSSPDGAYPESQSHRTSLLEVSQVPWPEQVTP